MGALRSASGVGEWNTFLRSRPEGSARHGPTWWSRWARNRRSRLDSRGTVRASVTVVAKRRREWGVLGVRRP